MNQILAYSFLIGAITMAAIPIIGYIRAKYYYVDTTPIRYWLNKKQKAKKRYKTFKKRNKKYLNVSKIGAYYFYGKKYKTSINQRRIN